MGLYDVIDDIAQRQIQKTDTGDNRIYGVVVGIVTKNYDKSMPGRVCVEIPSRDAEANELRWARLAFPFAGKSWGHYFLPEVDDQVLVAFEQGNIEKPYIVGCLHRDNDKMLSSNADEFNTYKTITTKHGSTIKFTDNHEEEQGEKDKLEAFTAGEKHSIIMDNEKHLIHIKDKPGNNQIKISTEDDKGNILITTDKKLTIKVGDTITLTMNGENGTVTLKSTKVNFDIDDAINMESQQTFKAKGTTVNLDANATLNLKSAGATMVKGMPIKIG